MFVFRRRDAIGKSAFEAGLNEDNHDRCWCRRPQQDESFCTGAAASFCTRLTIIDGTAVWAPPDNLMVFLEGLT